MPIMSKNGERPRRRPVVEGNKKNYAAVPRWWVLLTDGQGSALRVRVGMGIPGCKSLPVTGNNTPSLFCGLLGEPDAHLTALLAASNSSTKDDLVLGFSGGRTRSAAIVAHCAAAKRWRASERHTHTHMGPDRHLTDRDPGHDVAVHGSIAGEATRSRWGRQDGVCCAHCRASRVAPPTDTDIAQRGIYFRARRTDRQTDRQTHWALLRLPSGPRPEGQEMRNLLGALGKGFCGHGKRPAGGAMRCSHHHRQLGHRCCFNDDDCTASWGADQPPIIHRMRSSRRPVPNTTTARFFARLRGRMQ